MAADSDDEEALKARLDKLAGDLKSARRQPLAQAPLTPADRSTGAAWSMATKSASEFIGSIVVGTAIGWGLDRWLHTKPAFIIIFFLVGVVAGVWGVIRAARPKEG
jgi:F0F1-type ATP synthase assembly protein I